MDNSDVSRKLVGYLKRMTGLLPESMSSLEHTRLIALFFSVIGTDLLCETHGMAAHDLIEWVYSHQITTVSNKKHIHGGFRSILYTDASVGLDKPVATFSLCDHSHVTMVYAALCILVTLGDDLSRIDRSSVLTGIAALQCKDEPGLFSAGLVCPERDIRFVFSAVASSYILNGLDVLDTEAVVEFIGKCLTYEGGFACLPYLETHAGATYCALASLTLLSRLHSFLPVGSRPRERLIRWLSSLQSEGFHGRLYKSDDTCYTFWVCASLQSVKCDRAAASEHGLTSSSASNHGQSRLNTKRIYQRAEETMLGGGASLYVPWRTARCVLKTQSFRHIFE
ncbi:hypothetical protein EG68_10872 [Paragonimus skrjabini miyazakii]|uniref:Prenyltransferase alpha-alpha toroid domain-containing protein n=1 Tax=Paragonimus skrjabini miyazakii TaxID=59628 RepID=A0A8S9YK35_9TREM|nr:hypothetical protein EG68_10872 [Paragonimus skrjabini miyazakii]